MSRISDFIALTTRDRDILNPKTARSLDRILTALENTSAGQSWAAALESLRAHINNKGALAFDASVPLRLDDGLEFLSDMLTFSATSASGDPLAAHPNFVLRVTKPALLDWLYAQYVAISPAPVTRVQFDTLYAEDSSVLVELILRIVLNFYERNLDIDPQVAAPYLYNEADAVPGDLVMPPAHLALNTMITDVLLTPAATGAAYYQPAADHLAAALGVSGTLVIYLQNLVAAPEADRVVFQLGASDTDDTLIVTHLSAAPNTYDVTATVGGVDYTVVVTGSRPDEGLAILYGPSGIQTMILGTDESLLTDAVAYQAAPVWDSLLIHRPFRLPMDGDTPPGSLRSLIVYPPLMTDAQLRLALAAF